MISYPQAWTGLQALAQEGGPLQLSLFDERDLAEITSPDFPGERLDVAQFFNENFGLERTRNEWLGLAESDYRRFVSTWKEKPPGRRPGAAKEVRRS
jgi:hypothetical protein